MSSLSRGLSPGSLLRQARELSDQCRYYLRRYRSAMPRQKELLILSSTGNSHGLVSPFHSYRRDLTERLGLGVRELTSDSLEQKRRALEGYNGDYALVSVPLWLPDGSILPREEVHSFFESLDLAPETKLIFFDSSDNPIGRHFDCAPFVHRYGMPFSFSDPIDYSREFLGGNKFADFMSGHYGLAPSPENEYHPELFASTLAADQQDKLFTLWNWQFMPRLQKLYGKQGQRCLLGGERLIDVHCRFTAYCGWCQTHRLAVRDSLRALDGKYQIVASDEKVPPKVYFEELEVSKILFSPFGWGEICPKDWEAFFKGCLLIKPSVEHIRSNPGTHIPYETYVPVQWDLSDLKETLTYYLENHQERERIVRNAAQVVENYFHGNGFLKTVTALLD